jgi:5-(aminomethyl)-3-furanmethanol phosphate kinase
MWIVKLGGSLARDPCLTEWLGMLAEVGGGRVAVVPGGAGFADAVRKAQAHWGFNDVAAHNMAALAMAQTALMLHALEPRLVLATQEPEIRQALHGGRVALWFPLTLLRDAPDTLTSWEVTGDSLALWLARRLNAERLIVVKACRVEPGHSLADMVGSGVLDARFAAWARNADFSINVVQHDATERVRQDLLGGSAQRTQ